MDILDERIGILLEIDDILLVLSWDLRFSMSSQQLVHVLHCSWQASH